MLGMNGRLGKVPVMPVSWFQGSSVFELVLSAFTVHAAHLACHLAPCRVGPAKQAARNPGCSPQDIVYLPVQQLHRPVGYSCYSGA